MLTSLRNLDWSVTRADRVVMRLLLVLAGVAMGLQWVVGPLYSWITGGALLLSSVPAASSDPVTLGSGVRVDQTTYDLLLSDPTAGERLVALLPGLVLLGVTLGGIRVAWGILRDLAAGELFVRRNVTRLRVLGVLLILGWGLAVLADGAIGPILVADRLDGPSAVTLTLSVPAVLAGLAVAVVAEALAAGVALREDADGLV